MIRITLLTLLDRLPVTWAATHSFIFVGHEGFRGIGSHMSRWSGSIREYHPTATRLGADRTLHLHSQGFKLTRHQSKPRAVSLACTPVSRRIKPNMTSSPNPINHPFEGKYT